LPPPPTVLTIPPAEIAEKTPRPTTASTTRPPTTARRTDAGQAPATKGTSSLRPAEDSQMRLTFSASVPGDWLLLEPRKHPEANKTTVFEGLPQGQDLAFVFRPGKGGTGEKVTLRLPSTRIAPTTCKYISREDPLRVKGSGCAPAEALRPEQTARHAAAIAAFADALRKAAESAIGVMVDDSASDEGEATTSASAELLGIRVSGRTFLKDWIAVQDVVVVDMPLEPKGQYQRIEVNDFAIRDTHVLTERNWGQYISDYLSKRGVSTRLRYFADGLCDAELTLSGVAIQGVKAETASPDGTTGEHPRVSPTQPGRLELTASVPGTWAFETSSFKEGVSRYTVFEIPPVAGDLALLFVPDKDGKAEQVRVSLPPARRVNLPIEERRQAAVIAALLDALRKLVESAFGGSFHSNPRLDPETPDAIVTKASGTVAGIRLTTTGVSLEFITVYDAIVAEIPLDRSGEYERLTVQDFELLDVTKLKERDWARYLTELLQQHGAQVKSRFAEDGLCEVTLTFDGTIMSFDSDTKKNGARALDGGWPIVDSAD